MKKKISDASGGSMQILKEGIGDGLSENQIVVYQPDSVIRLEVRFDGETVWLPQPQIAELFSCSVENVRLHLKNIYAIGELDKAATSKESLEVRREGMRNVTRKFVYYNLDAIISIGYRINSIVGVRFRQWATRVIKGRMLARTVQAGQFAVIERRLSVHDRDIAELKDKVDFFVQTQTPPLQGVFYNGQLWDARALVLSLVTRAKRSLLLIDNWATAATLDLFAKKRKGVKVTIITSEHYRDKVPHHQIFDADIETFNAQYPKLTIRYNETFHDRLLIIDNKEIYLIGASLKDLGAKCFAFTKLDSGTIRGIKKSAFTPTLGTKN
ncbi:MAG: virulence RhuM family protein [Kiritimatiellae bacterium]|nr:virulence RhuM family protein [Kiritimatiellia bacterium]